MSEQPQIRSVLVGMSQLGRYFIGRQLMLRECLTREHR